MRNFHLNLLTLILISTVTFIHTIPYSIAVDWSSDTRLTIDSNADFSPSVTQTHDGRVWIFWHSLRLGNGNAELFYKTYDGLTWTDDTRLTYSAGHDVNPAAVTTKEGTIWLAWSSNRLGNYSLFYKTSSDNGSSWSPEIQLTNTASYNKRPSVMQAADGRIWVVWFSNRTGNDELFYKIHDGVSWSPEIQFSFNEDPDRAPSVMQSMDGRIWVFWSAYRPIIGDFEIFCKTSSDNGVAWSAETRLTDNNSWDMLPSAMQARDGTIWVVWEADRSALDDDLYYKTYDGVSWSSDTKLTGDSGSDEIQPSIFQSENKAIWIAFSSSWVGDFDIYYKTATNPHDIGILSVTPSSIYAYKEYGIKIDVNVRNYGTSAETFTVTVYYNGTSIETQTVTNLAPDATLTLNLTWSVIQVPLGYYVLSASTGFITGEADPSDNSLIDGTMHVRIAGDVNGDRSVNVYDAILISTYFGKFNEFPAGDINNDGRINVYDTIILSTHFGESG